ncbi:MAG: tRNA (5-methylaminomethyl-2-thiouridine)(34)-methyltransferase MnmD [Bacteroidetes bacterium]|nr:tRNA (5-methylaminomethyl-2-thiouridine)(34)-methyltransferase MnmD [Bacteroidota bacterium]
MADFNKRKIIVTEDGSHSILVDDINEAYHSDRGSWQESVYTYVTEGMLTYLRKNPASNHIKIFEMGFGTGLNAFVSLLSKPENVSIHYCGIEAYPVGQEEYSKLNYAALAQKESQPSFLDLHICEWNSIQKLSDSFWLEKLEGTIQETPIGSGYQVVYFDAFSPRTQPELWQPAIFQKVYDSMDYGGVLVSYSAAGIFKRSMQAAGFWMEEIRGARGKREMVRGIKM